MGHAIPEPPTEILEDLIQKEIKRVTTNSATPIDQLKALASVETWEEFQAYKERRQLKSWEIKDGGSTWIWLK